MGTSRAQYHLRQVCVYLDLHPLNKAGGVRQCPLPAVLTRHGDVCATSALLGQLAAQMQALKDWTLRLRA